MSYYAKNCLVSTDIELSISKKKIVYILSLSSPKSKNEKVEKKYQYDFLYIRQVRTNRPQTTRVLTLCLFFSVLSITASDVDTILEIVKEILPNLADVSYACFNIYARAVDIATVY